MGTSGHFFRFGVGGQGDIVTFIFQRGVNTLEIISPFGGAPMGGGDIRGHREILFLFFVCLVRLGKVRLFFAFFGKGTK